MIAPWRNGGGRAGMWRWGSWREDRNFSGWTTIKIYFLTTTGTIGDNLLRITGRFVRVINYDFGFFSLISFMYPSFSASYPVGSVSCKVNVGTIQTVSVEDPEVG